MPPKAPKAPKGGETLGGILFGGTLYAIAVSGMASLLENTNDNKKDSKEEAKQAEPKEESKPAERNWIQRQLKEPGYYTKQVEEEFKRNAEPLKYYTSPILELSEQDRLQAERMLKP
ncbi:hypothetical protein FVER14953_21392 [Fusarium verticillioides]|nr:hypothetical protein FVER14953_21392 [Fusarium verticillioides]